MMADDKYIHSEGIDLKDLLLDKKPYKNIKTKQIKYLDQYEVYALTSFPWRVYEVDDFQNTWEPIEDSKVLRLLYDIDNKKDI